MKKLLILIIGVFVLIPLASQANSNLSDRLSGRILLQVEEKGEAWYIEPTTKERAFLGRPDDAFRVMRELGLGISEKDFKAFGEYAPKRLSGRIILRVEANGEAYYVNPVDSKMHFLGRPIDAFQVMRNLGLGVTNQDLERIKDSQKYSKIKELDMSISETQGIQSPVLGTNSTPFVNEIKLTWENNRFAPNDFYVRPNEILTMTVNNNSENTSLVLNYLSESLRKNILGVSSLEEKSISFIAPKIPGVYLFVNSAKFNSLNQPDKDHSIVCDNKLPVYGRLIVTNSDLEEAENSYKEEVSWQCNE